MKKLLISSRFWAALGLAFLGMTATPALASATGTIGCNQVIGGHNG